MAGAHAFRSCTPSVWWRYRRSQPSLLAAIGQLRAAEWWDAERIAEYQLRQVRELVDFAYANTRYYRELFDDIGLECGSDVRTLRDIERIPVLTKDVIRERLPELTVARDDLVANHTGGSTGVPLKFYNDPPFLHVLKLAAMYRAYGMAGYRLGDAMAKIWGFDRGLPPLDRHGRADGILKTYPLNSFELTPATMTAFIARLRRDRVAFVTGYATSLFTVARFMSENGLELHGQVRAVFSEAERLDARERRDIERAFDARVFDYYGCREFSTNAVECQSHCGLHVNFHQLYTEVAPSGAILLTSFKNRGTLFIRYQVGDYADELLTASCACGRHSPRLRRVVGRQSDQFVTPDGRRIHGEFVTHLFYDAPGVRQFQVVQKSHSHFVVSAVADDAAAAREHVAVVMRRLGDKLGYPVTFDCQLVASIPATRSGKMKFTITELTA